MRLITWLRELSCQHEDVLRLSESRMWLECLACGRETRGIAVGHQVREDLDHRRVHAEWIGQRAIDRAADRAA